MLISFILFLCIFIVIGLLSSVVSKNSNKDYLLAGKSVPPWLVALSAVATNNSGYMFIGMIGLTYLEGFSSIWLMLGWIVGDFLASSLIHKRLRLQTDDTQSLSFAGVLSRWQGSEFRGLRMLLGLVTIIFLSVYAAAQFKAGSKALHVLLGWDYSTGAIIGAVIVFLYCLAGGIRASIWTDAAQSFVMIIAMGTLLFEAVVFSGGFDLFIQNLFKVSPNYMGIVPPNLIGKSGFEFTLFIFGWLMAGVGVIGQPHIMIRFMTLDDPSHMKRTRFYYYVWFSLFYALTIGVGLATRILLPEVASFDAELALPTLAQQILPDVFTGLVLAGLFAATMSTADSQILSCSAALTRDFSAHPSKNPLISKLGTLIVTLCALVISLYGPDSVFNLVLIAWSFLACSFGPLLILYSLRVKLNEFASILVLLSGSVTVLLWRVFELNKYTYEVAPGFVVALFVGYICSLFMPKKIFIS